ncbi:hypothetical protein HNR23_001722 [Nocardiopsis mwathae]|uniref:Uncharacterized protein n=1 Tax=Nocardiopsis mwathae TaxID=1472723 RepID=A0A7X0D4T9_9ACTN|nr:hypothetical protein [Nocardiopsis mwathae]MBB6171662.1 hypothetical protein [Nocardiopsis mwathae]
MQQTLTGPACPTCRHPSCRAARAADQPLNGGRRAEYAAEHRRADALAARHPGPIIWWGEHTMRYHALTTSGHYEAPDIDELVLLIRRYIEPRGFTGPKGRRSTEPGVALHSAVPTCVARPVPAPSPGERRSGRLPGPLP